VAFTPSLQQQVVGLELRELREEAGVSLKRATDLTGFSPSKLSRIESVTHELDPGDLKILMDIYGVPRGAGDPVRSRLHRLLNVSANPRAEWWRRHEWLPEGLKLQIQAEASARKIWSSHGLIIPGLLQTRDYARRLFEDGGRSADRLEEAVEVRMLRQRIFEQTSSSRLWCCFFLGEAVLSSGPSDALGAQLNALIELATHSNINLRVVPRTTLVPVHGTTIYDFDFGRSLGVIDHPWRSEIVTMGDTEGLGRIRASIDRYESHALSPKESVELIKRKWKEAQ